MQTNETIKSLIDAIRFGIDPTMALSDIDEALEDGEITEAQARRLIALTRQAAI